MCVVVGMYVMLPTTEVDPEIKEGGGHTGLMGIGVLHAPHACI